MMHNRRSTRMRGPTLHRHSSTLLQQHTDCDRRSDDHHPATGCEDGGSVDQKVSFISCARGFPLEQEGPEFEFEAPALAPVFRPSEQEFAAGPIKYIASIRHLAEPYGICKIIPPAVSSQSS